jgi:hypothetical protein
MGSSSRLKQVLMTRLNSRLNISGKILTVYEILLASLSLRFWTGFLIRGAIGFDNLNYEEYRVDNIKSEERMQWKIIDPTNLPEGEVLAANFQPRTYGFQEKLLGYLNAEREDEGICCDDDNGFLSHCTHYIDINAFDMGEPVGEKDNTR